ncbi:hypothetical protein [Marinomonas sp.]
MYKFQLSLFCPNLIVSSAVLMTFFATNANAMDLIAFGNACLVKEAQLTATKETLDALTSETRQKRSQSNAQSGQLDSVIVELTDLQDVMDECQEVDRNSSYCHQIRIRYNRLVDLETDLRLQLTQQDSAIFDDDLAMEKTLNTAKYESQHANFIARCRDSDTHYQLLNDPNAYESVCLKPDAKQSITCSLF